VKPLGQKNYFLAKYVRPDKVDGCYLESNTGGAPIINTWVGGEC
jgi:hypothetical protein